MVLALLFNCSTPVATIWTMAPMKTMRSPTPNSSSNPLPKTKKMVWRLAQAQRHSQGEYVFPSNIVFDDKTINIDAGTHSKVDNSHEFFFQGIVCPISDGIICNCWGRISVNLADDKWIQSHRTISHIEGISIQQYSRQQLHAQLWCLVKSPVRSGLHIMDWLASPMVSPKPMFTNESNMVLTAFLRGSCPHHCQIHAPLKILKSLWCLLKLKIELLLNATMALPGHSMLCNRIPLCPPLNSMGSSITPNLSPSKNNSSWTLSGLTTPKPTIEVNPAWQPNSYSVPSKAKFPLTMHTENISVWTTCYFDILERIGIGWILYWMKTVCLWLNLGLFLACTLWEFFHSIFYPFISQQKLKTFSQD